MRDDADKLSEIADHIRFLRDDLLKDVIERCARIADLEEEPEGVMLPELQGVSTEEVVRAAIRATKKNIADNIRSLLK